MIKWKLEADRFCRWGGGRERETFIKNRSGIMP